MFTIIIYSKLKPERSINMSLNEDQTSSCDHSNKLEPSNDNAELGDQITLLAAQINAATYQFFFKNSAPIKQGNN